MMRVIRASSNIFQQYDEYLFEFLYGCVRLHDVLSSYTQFVDIYSDRAGRATHDDACRRLEDILSDLEYYRKCIQI